jgi:hypothetical protein
VNAEIEAKIEEYYSLKPAQYRVLKSAILTQDIDTSTGEMQQQLSLVLARDDSFSGEMLHVELSGVRNLKLHQPSWSLVTLSNLEIVQSPPTGKYDRRYVVLDAEEGIVSCSCHDFFAAIA